MAMPPFAATLALNPHPSPINYSPSILASCVTALRTKDDPGAILEDPPRAVAESDRRHVEVLSCPPRGRRFRRTTSALVLLKSHASSSLAVKPPRLGKDMTCGKPLSRRNRDPRSVGGSQSPVTDIVKSNRLGYIVGEF